MIQRRFIPGSEWIYFKLYTGTKTADLLLMQPVYALVNNLMKSGIVDKFFFIRYSDPDFHIRLRLHLSDPTRYGLAIEIFHSFFSKYVDNGSVFKVMCDTYVREIERYGAETMLLTEDVFYIDSDAILSLISCDESLMLRWHQAFLLADDLIQAFILKIEDRCKFTFQSSNTYRQEFGFESSIYTKQLNDKYRTLRPQIERLMLREGDPSVVYSILENRKKQLSILAVMISERLSNNNLLTLDNLLGSYIHMTINRLFRSKNRLNELIIYDYLNRFYSSILAREKYKGK
jgi:thiopeptide-type bacteriocin biosynthesis protein